MVHSRVSLRLLGALVAMSALATALADPQETYPDKYDNVDLDEILSNERLYKKYLECLLADTDSKCTADGKELRKSLPEALTNDCAKCSPKQRAGTQKVVRFIRKNKEGDWTLLAAKWDPEGVYVAKYAKDISE